MLLIIETRHPEEQEDACVLQLKANNHQLLLSTGVQDGIHLPIEERVAA
jgi:hypothetical protein